MEILRAEGVTVHEVRNWRTHNRNAKGPWGPMNGVVIHHTVTWGTDSPVALCHDGYAPPPDPLCHGAIDKKGHVHMVGNGRANHAGLGDGDGPARLTMETACAPASRTACGASRAAAEAPPPRPQPRPQPRPRPEYEALPGAGSFRIGRRDPLITAMGKRLVVEGCGRYEEGPSPDRRQAGRRSPGQSRSVHPMKLKRT
ncbi:N-acetylmuramoyl-L-alanine amidase [Streptomyces sp. AS02]|uniref:N-acetylmuramoyl-L-alanine amidase n=1 Tax=Streptomyces sp. AS02 TaxID=2938946 RepID=UPI00202286C8|nr:N-acetylmuramoyl-L-alanine amidase [Streptomyces sp. AS02]MCL8009731.1 N-acetylmuramoyl-L-alanine amidase [Streptomyces sp. AS02]